MSVLKPIDWVQSISEKKKQILTGTLSVIGGVAILIGYFQSGPSAMNYALAEEAFSEWRASPNDDQLYENMKGAISALPALQKKYESAIAQKLLNTDKIDEALAMANRSLNRVKGEVPFHATYAGTTLLIEQGRFQQALENAVALKEQMGSSFLTENKGGSLLYVHNLLRIACLQQELQNRPGEKAAWDELEKFIQTEARSAKTLLSGFSEKKINLNQYIEERKKALS